MKKIAIFITGVVMKLTIPFTTLAAYRRYSGNCLNYAYSNKLYVNYPIETRLEDDNTFCRLGSTSGTATNYQSEIYLNNNFLGGYYYLSSGNSWYVSFSKSGDFQIKFTNPHSTRIYFNGIQKSW